MVRIDILYYTILYYAMLYYTMIGDFREPLSTGGVIGFRLKKTNEALREEYDFLIEEIKQEKQSKQLPRCPLMWKLCLTICFASLVSLAVFMSLV